MDNGLSDQHKYDDHNNNKSYNSQSNSKANLNKIDDLNIS